LGLKDLLFKKKEPNEILIDHFKMLSLYEETELTLSFNGQPERYRSILFGLSKKEKSFDGILIDTVVPGSGNELLVKSKSIKVRYQFRGANYTFSCKFIKVEKGKFDSYKLSIPEKIIKISGKKHERDSYRAITSIADPVYVILNSKSEKMIDLSTGGFSFLTARSLEHFLIGKQPLPITVSKPSQKISFDADVRVCHFVANAFNIRGVKKHKAAVQFISKLRFNEEEAIAQYVLDRQRESLQKTNTEEF